jgi:hypothetical protein
MPKKARMPPHLQGDVKECAKQLRNNDSPFWRRTFFRAVFSMIEAFNSSVAEKATAALVNPPNRKYNISALLLLSGREYKIAQNGTVTSSKSRPPLLNFTGFLIRTLAQAGNVRKHYIGQNGWSDFQKAIQIRNRITHAKTKRDAEVSNQDINALMSGLAWYLNSLTDIVNRSKLFTFPEDFTMTTSPKPQKRSASSQS